MTKRYERDRITQNALRELRNIKNPFQYSGVVRGDAFCNRREEVEDLLRAMEKGEKLFAYSESSIGFSKPGYRKHKVENSQGTVRGGTLMSSVKKLVNPNRRRVNGWMSE